MRYKIKVDNNFHFIQRYIEKNNLKPDETNNLNVNEAKYIYFNLKERNYYCREVIDNIHTYTIANTYIELTERDLNPYPMYDKVEMDEDEIKIFERWILE